MPTKISIFLDNLALYLIGKLNCVTQSMMLQLKGKLSGVVV